MLASKLAASVWRDAEAGFSTATGQTGRSGNAHILIHLSQIQSVKEARTEGGAEREKDAGTGYAVVVSLVLSASQRMVTNGD